MLLLGGALPLGARTLDLNGNGMSDIWEQIYGASGLNPNVDTDGDGVTNRQESIAGTDPFDPKSFPHITVFGPSGGTFNVTMACALGKQYQLQSITSLDGTNYSSNWVTEASVIVRSGTNVTLTGTTGPTTKFFRIAISDVDTDGDGLNDWEEYQLGTDPLNAFSNGQMDGNGVPLNDYQYVAGKWASQNVFTINASTPVAVQPDPGQKPLTPGAYTISRGGFPLRSITVNLALAGPGPGFAVEGVDHQILPRQVFFPVGASSETVALTPLADTNLDAPVIAMLELAPGTNYTIGTASNASVVIYPSPTGKGTGLMGYYYTNANSTYTNAANFNPANFKMSRLDPTINFVWGNTTNPITNNGYYCVRWEGQVQPQYSELYYFDAYTDDGVKVYVNDQLVVDNWTAHTAVDSVGTIQLQAGVRYDIRMDYFQQTGSAVAELYWYSADQSKEIIPSTAFYPTNSTPPTPTAVTSPLTAYAFVGQPFNYDVTAANVPLAFSAGGLPPGLTFNSTNGLITGVPTTAGNYDVSLTASNAIGLSSSALLIDVISNASSVVREIWTNVPGVNVSDIPVATPASLTNTLPTLQGVTGYGMNYGERVRGYFTAPSTGNYYFWISGSDSAQLWISDDSDEVDQVERAYVLPNPNPAPPPTNGTAPLQWNLQTNQQSGWLSLVAGQQYYVEVLHKAGNEPDDNWAVGWIEDPTGTNTTPAGVVPGYLLSRYYPPLTTSVPGTLYAANMLALPGVTSEGVGSASLRVNSAGTQATLSFSTSDLSSPAGAEAINSDPFSTNGSLVLFDISASPKQPDGTYLWNIGKVGPFSPAQVLQIIQNGQSFISIGSDDYPNGEISGHFILANGSQTFTPPPAPPAWTDDHTNPNAAARFLTQATFGPSPADVASVESLGYSNWINNQFSLPASHLLPVVLAGASPDPTEPYPSSLFFDTWWQQSVTAPDQLRQRVAFALSEIMVVSENGVLANSYGQCLAAYYDMLLDNAFGNYRNLLENATLAPAMGLYLNMLGNGPGSIITGLHANENYAREDMQLFSIGLNRMWPDGSLVMNSQGSLVPTYDQNVIMGFASAYTGWNYYQTNQANGLLPVNWHPAANYTNPMVLVPTEHELGTKLLLDNVTLPPAYGLQTNAAYTNCDNYCSQDLEAAMNSIFNSPNVGPFIARELIQRLVTSNPSRDYVYRVAQVFNDNGSGVRGDMQAVIKAILLDYEARSTDMLTDPTYGKQREPLLRVTAPARAFPPPAPDGGGFTQNNTQIITVTMTNAHLLNNGDTTFLTFNETNGNPAPPAQGYSVTVTSPTAFTVTAPGFASVGTYGQTNGTLTVAVSGNGVTASTPVYLIFTTGGATNGIYTVASVIDTTHFTASTADTTTRNGACLIPKLTGGGYVVTSKTNLLVTTSLQHGLAPLENVYLNFNAAGSPPDGEYQIVTVPAPNQFTAIVPSTGNQTQDNLTIYPLVAPVMVRSGTVAMQEDTWNMGYTDSGSSSSLSQTPLRPPTVFNFFYPNYMFPGALAAAGLTTPEFQLTSASSAAEQMNFLEGGILGNTGNTNGLSSFASGNGSIVLDIDPWMTQANTSNTGVPGLVSSLSSLLCAGQLSPIVQSQIASYVTNTVNFPYSSPPTDSQMRDRVRAVIHLIIDSPDFTIQK
jgi:fibro-slime domain-containing protein